MAEFTNPERRMLRAMQQRDGNWNLEEVLEGAEGGGHYTESRWFGGIVAITVLANAIQMGVAADFFFALC